jgi:hypothetical protein
MFGAAVTLIALSLAPSIGSAHGTHEYGSRGAVTHSAPPADGVQANKAAEIIHAELTSVSSGHTHAHLIPGCTGHCCCGAPCTACCAVAVTAVAHPSPPTGHALVRLPDSNALWALHPDGLRRPPRFFA